jgi:hypothetical protein
MLSWTIYYSQWHALVFHKKIMDDVVFHKKNYGRCSVGLLDAWEKPEFIYGSYFAKVALRQSSTSGANI